MKSKCNEKTSVNHSREDNENVDLWLALIQSKLNIQIRFVDAKLEIFYNNINFRCVFSSTP